MKTVCEIHIIMQWPFDGKFHYVGESEFYLKDTNGIKVIGSTLEELMKNYNVAILQQEE